MLHLDDFARGFAGVFFGGIVSFLINVRIL